jgi:hypothetical protein
MAVKHSYIYKETTWASVAVKYLYKKARHKFQVRKVSSLALKWLLTQVI